MKNEQSRRPARAQRVTNTPVTICLGPIELTLGHTSGKSSLGNEGRVKEGAGGGEAPPNADVNYAVP